jgi:hypothetical protein
MNDEERIRQAMAIVRTRDARHAPSVESVQIPQRFRMKPQLQWVQVASAAAAVAVLSVGGYGWFTSTSSSRVAAVSQAQQASEPAPPSVATIQTSVAPAATALAIVLPSAGPFAFASTPGEAQLPIASTTHLVLSLDFLLETNNTLLSGVPGFEGDR